MTVQTLLTAIASVTGLLFVVGSMLATVVQVDNRADSSPSEERAHGGSGASGQLRTGATTRLRHHKTTPTRFVTADRVDRARHGGWCAVPGEGGSGSQG